MPIDRREFIIMVCTFSGVILGIILSTFIAMMMLGHRVADLEFVIEQHQTVLEHLTEGLRHEQVPQRYEFIAPLPNPPVGL